MHFAGRQTWAWVPTLPTNKTSENNFPYKKDKIISLLRDSICKVNYNSSTSNGIIVRLKQINAPKSIVQFSAHSELLFIQQISIYIIIHTIFLSS